MLVQLTLSSHLREGLSDSSMLKDKSGSVIFSRGGQIETESMSGQGRPEEGADCSAVPSQMNQSSCVCWVDECVRCVFALSIWAQTAGFHARRQPGFAAGSRK